jgi:site-specific DNA recombinase
MMIDRRVSKGIRVVGVQDGYDSARKLQAGLSGIIGEAFREMIKDRTYSALESRVTAGTATGGRAYGYNGGEVAPAEAGIVREIFTRYAEGASCRTIATALNSRGIPSPGSTWNRTERRAAGGRAQVCGRCCATSVTAAVCTGTFASGRRTPTPQRKSPDSM